MYRYYLAFESRGRIYDGEGYSIIEERDIYIFIERLATLLKDISENLDNIGFLRVKLLQSFEKKSI